MTKGDIIRFGGDSAAGHKAGEPSVYAPGNSLFARLGRGVDGFVFLGLVVLVVFILRSYDARTSWRGLLLLLGIVSVVGCLAWRPVRWRSVVPLVRRLVVFGSGIAAVVVVASVFGATFEVSKQQFMLGFVLPLLLPWLVVNHVRDPQRWHVLMYALVVAGLVLVARNLLQYLQEFRAFGKLSSDITLHRNFSANFVFGLPFVLWFAVASRGRWQAIVGWSLVPLVLIMIAGTGARGAWIAAIVVLVVFLVFLRSRRLWLVAAGAAAVAIVLAVTVVPPELLVNRIQQGMDTSMRTSGTWGPAIEIMSERPWLGYGFGDEVFSQEFNRRVADAEHWTIKRSIGPHNFFLGLGVAAGVPAMIALLGMLGVSIWAIGQRAWPRVSCGAADRDFALSGVTVIAAVSGAYLVVGNVESIPWNLFALWFGMSLSWLQIEGRPALPG